MLLDTIRKQFEPENRVFRILKKVDENKRSEILEEMIFQFMPKKHIHGNPRRKDTI